MPGHEWLRDEPPSTLTELTGNFQVWRERIEYTDVMIDPNFMLIGAQKCGTSWLAAMLSQHPDIFVPEKKELHFFNVKSNYARGIEWYREQFDGWSGQELVGDCTPNYLWGQNAVDSVQKAFRTWEQSPNQIEDYGFLNSNTAELIWQQYPDLKLIVSLRDPVERAISGFMHFIRSRYLSPRSRILDVGGQRGILALGFYYGQLLEWMKYFPRDRFLFLIYEEDIVQHKSQTLREVFGHLGVDADFEAKDQSVVRNKRSTNLYMFVNYYAPWLPGKGVLNRIPALQKYNLPPISVTADDRAKLYELFQPEYSKLENLIGRSLEVWEPRTG